MKLTGGIQPEIYVPAPNGFTVERTEVPSRGIVKYRFRLDRTLDITISEEADVHDAHRGEAIVHALHQLAKDARDFYGSMVTS